MSPITHRRGSLTALEEQLRAAVREKRRLRRELHQARLAASRAAELVFTVDLTRSRYDYVSPNAENLTGFTAEEWHRLGPAFMLGRFPAPDLAAVGSKLQRAVEQTPGHSAQTTLIHRWIDKFDHLHWYSASIALELGRHKKLLAASSMMRECMPAERVECGLILCPQRRGSTIDLPGFPAGWERGGRVCPLTPAECVILALILQGLTNKQIAARLHRSRRTVEDHRNRLMHKLNATNAADLVIKALRDTCGHPEGLHNPIP